MGNGLAWSSSLNAKLRGITLLLLLSSGVLIASNIVLLSALRGNAAKQKLFGEGTSYAYQLLADGYKFTSESDAARAHTTSEMRSIMRANTLRYQTLLQGDPAHDIRPVTDPDVRASLAERAERWRREFIPALERLLDAPTRVEALNARNALEAMLETYASATIHGADQEQGVLTGQVERVKYLQYAFAGFVAVIIGCVWLLAQQTSQRAQSLAAVARRIAGGEISLRAPSAGKDELAVLGHAFNTMTQTLHSTIDAEKQGRTRLEKLLATVGDTAASVASATAEILAGTTQQAAGARKQAVAVMQTVTTVDQAVQTSEQAAKRAHVVAEAAQRSVETGKLGREAVQNAVSSMTAIKDQTEVVAEAILALAERTQRIAQITFAINDLAEQTHVLALNASIEASRAGEHGRAFGVVANEVKSLADQSKQANTQVRELLSEIQPAATSAVMSAEEASKSVNGAIKVVNEAGDTITSLLDTIDEASQAAAHIAASARQQSLGMAQIHVAMNHINEASNQSLASSRQAELAARDLNVRGVELSKLLAS